MKIKQLTDICKDLDQHSSIVLRIQGSAQPAIS